MSQCELRWRYHQGGALYLREQVYDIYSVQVFAEATNMYAAIKALQLRCNREKRTACCMIGLRNHACHCLSLSMLSRCCGVFVLCMNDPLAKASYRSVIRTARDVVADIGEEAALQSGGLADLARVPESKSERDGICESSRRKLPQFACSAHIAWRSGSCVPILRLRDWGQFLADKHCLHMLVGLAKPDFQRETDICQAFWTKYKQLQPDHEIYQRFEAGSVDPKFTFPLVFHGDEGRGRRRLPFLVCNYHSLLGKGTQEQCGQHRAYLKLRMNFKDNSLVPRLLYCAVPKKLHQKPQVFEALMESAVAEAEFTVNTGVVQRYTGRKV